MLIDGNFDMKIFTFSVAHICVTVASHHLCLIIIVDLFAAGFQTVVDFGAASLNFAVFT